MELGISTLGHNIEYGMVNRDKYKDLIDLFLDSTQACLKLSEDQGFKVCEIIIESPDIFKDDIRTKFIEICNSFAITKQVHGPFIDMGLCSHNNAISMASVQSYIDAAELTNEIGAKVFTIHPGVANFLINALHGYNRKQLMKAVHLLLDKLTDLDLIVCIENMPNTCHILGTDKNMIEFFEDMQRRGIALSRDLFKK